MIAMVTGKPTAATGQGPARPLGVSPEASGRTGSPHQRPPNPDPASVLSWGSGTSVVMRMGGTLREWRSSPQPPPLGQGHRQQWSETLGNFSMSGGGGASTQAGTQA